MAGSSGNLLKANYSEDVVGFALDSFLAVTSFPRQRVTIEPFSKGVERWLGADAKIVGKIKGFKPFYMQFKKPFAYPDYSYSKIIKNRKDLSLETSPISLFFNLREKGKKHAFYQHNVLYKLNKRLKKFTNGDAVYVCPLFLDRSAYRFHLHLSGLRKWWVFGSKPWDRRDVFVEDYGKRHSFSDIPFLAEHVCIPPHRIVNSARHIYSFSEKGTDLCFHSSPEYLPEGITKLGAWMDLLLELSGKDIIDVREAKNKLKDLIFDDQSNDEILYPYSLFEIEDGLAAWSEWGKYLRETYSIQQYFIFVWEI